MRAADGDPTYEDLQQAATEGGLTKFFDVNLTQLLSRIPLRDTIEIRILPGMIDAGDVVTGPAWSNCCSTAARSRSPSRPHRRICRPPSTNSWTWRPACWRPANPPC